jgi:hypothetical protein
MYHFLFKVAAAKNKKKLPTENLPKQRFTVGARFC